MTSRTAIVIGAGPAGLTAALELLERTDVRPIVLERTDRVGGIATTIEYKGNRIDIGGHRFFSKSDRVMDWWLRVLPLEPSASEATITYRNQSRDVSGRVAVDAASDDVMLVRRRLSRILYGGRFFDYPVRLNVTTVRNLGIFRTIAILLSYVRARLFPIRPEVTLEDFLINRFGRELYEAFFESYTEKVWGVPCSRISAEWGAQRIKGLSISKAIAHALRRLVARDPSVRQKGTETSLIERFLYPKYGPGQMWQRVQSLVEERGGAVHFGKTVVGIEVEGERLKAVEVEDRRTGDRELYAGELFFSTMPMSDLVQIVRAPVPDNVTEVARGLLHRDFVTVGLLLREMKVGDASDGGPRMTPDTWIYVQNPHVKVGRIQIFNNWSPYMVRDPNTVWIGLEYFCREGDELWGSSDEALRRLAVGELEQLGLVDEDDVLDATVIRMPKTYPAYFGTYSRIDEVRGYLDRFENLFLLGRNGMHKYNNQDHSMLTAMVAVDNVASGVSSKDAVWAVNTEMDYHEAK